MHSRIGMHKAVCSSIYRRGNSATAADDKDTDEEMKAEILLVENNTSLTGNEIVLAVTTIKKRYAAIKITLEEEEKNNKRKREKEMEKGRSRTRRTAREGGEPYPS
jgi:hypothetical protein